VVAASSPTVRRRRLAAELRRLRGGRTGTTVAKALGWSPAKISRYELGRTSFPLDEVEKLLDFYGVAEPRRTRLLALAEEANQRGWWEDYADAISAEYMEYIGLEAEAASVAIWENVAVPGMLQTEEYARRVTATWRVAVPVPPGTLDRRVQVRMIRQEILTRDPPLELSVVLDESVLLRKVGGQELMHAQLRHLAALSELPNLELRIFPLGREAPVFSASFEIFGFSAMHETGRLGDVVSTESVGSYLYVEGETDTYLHRLFFQAMADASLPPVDSRHLIIQTAERAWALLYTLG
jgi:transcriptional regulator with XRE-family HTH domain